MNKVLVIIAHWGPPEETTLCLNSLDESNFNLFDVFLCDNTNGAYLDVMGDYSFNIIRTSEENIGYSAAVNQGYAYAKENGYEYVWLLNNDTIVPKDSLNALVVYLDSNPKAGAVSPSLPYYKKPDSIWSNGGLIDWKNGSTRMITSSMDPEFNPDFLTGCALLVRASTIEEEWIISEKLSAYFEDVDLSMRIKNSGHGLVLLSQILVYHDIDDRERDASPLVVYLMTRNRYYFFSRYMKGVKKITTLSQIFFRDLRMILAFTLKPVHQSSRFKAKYVLLGMIDAFRKNYYMGAFK